MADGVAAAGEEGDDGDGVGDVEEHYAGRDHTFYGAGTSVVRFLSLLSKGRTRVLLPGASTG